MNIGMNGFFEPKDEEILTMAFVNFQPLDRIYSTADALMEGTLFPNINKPFCAGDRHDK